MTGTRAGRAPRLLEGRVLRGCNVHHRSSVFAQLVDLGTLAGVRTAEVGPGFAARFRDRFAGLPALTPGGCLRNEFLTELDGAEGVPIEQALLEAILAVERTVAHTMRRLDTAEFAKIVREPSSPGVVELVWECHAGSLSRAAARAGLAGLLELLELLAHEAFRRAGTTPGEFDTRIEKLRKRARRRQWSPTTAVLALAAKKRGLPFEPLAGAYLRLGEGSMQRLISTSAPELDQEFFERAVTGPEAPRDVGDEILERVFPRRAPSGVPVALILGERGTGAVARELDGLLRARGLAVGLVTRALTTIAGKPIGAGSTGSIAGARFVLGDPRVEVLVHAVSPRRVVARGLRIDRVEVTAVLDPAEGADPEVRRRGLDVCVSATRGLVVASADGASAGRLAGELEPRRVVLVSPREPGPALVRHLDAGGCAVVRVADGRDDLLELRRSRDVLGSVRVSSLRSNSAGVSERRVRLAMFATALALGLGLSGDEIVAALDKRRYFRR